MRLHVALAGLIVASLSATARARPAVDPDLPSAEDIAAQVGVGGDPPAAAEDQSWRATIDDADVMAVLAPFVKAGGVPYYRSRSGIVRRAPDPATPGIARGGDDAIQFNRALYWLTLGGVRYLAFDHMTSAVSAITTVWKVDGPRPVLAFEALGEIVDARPTADGAALTLFDIVHAGSAAWRKGDATFHGRWLLDDDGFDVASLAGFASEHGPIAWMRVGPRGALARASATDLTWGHSRLAAGTAVGLIGSHGDDALVIYTNGDRQWQARFGSHHYAIAVVARAALR